MTVLFGHPTGNPNSHHAALAHLEAGWLEAFCVPWMPSAFELALLSRAPGLKAAAARLARRSFGPLREAPKVQARWSEWGRLARRLVGGGWADERLSYEANDWLMRTMRRECRRAAVRAVHSYEDCSLLQFQAASKAGKACVYDLPIGYYPAWQATRERLARQYADWLPTGARDDTHARPRQKQQEMELADLVLVPSSFVRQTVLQFTDRKIALAPYGVDSEFWHPEPGLRRDGPMRFFYAGQCSVRKGVPFLIEAWRAARLPDAVLELAGPWRLSEAKKHELPPGVTLLGPLSPPALRRRYGAADVFVLATHFEGLALVIAEAMACGLPVIASDASGGADLVDASTGRIVPAADFDAWVESLRSAADRRDQIAAMRESARARAATMTWAVYRGRVRQAVLPYV